LSTLLGKRRLVSLVLCAAGVATRGGAAAAAPAGTVTSPSGLRHGVIWYARAASDDVRIRAAQRYSLGVTGKQEPSDPDKVFIKALNPDFHWYVYNSGTDNYVVSRPGGSGEHALLLAIAAQHGWDPEDGYLHYFDDTRIVLQGDTVSVPGWGGGSAATPDQARVPVYYADLSRRLANFATPRARQLQKEVMLRLAFGTPFNNSTLYPDGIFLDNSTWVLFNYGSILSGGRVREAPGNAAIGSIEFRNWFWRDNYGPFLTALKDTLEGSASWSPDGRRKFLMVNISNVWDDSYVSRDVADVLLLEFQYNPVRSFGPNEVAEAHRRDALAAAAGIASFYTATMTRTVSEREGQYTYAETMLGNLAWYLVTRTPSTFFYEMGTNAPSVAGWDSLTWRGCIDVANERLGAALGPPYTLAQGTDPLGNRYRIMARDYEGGLAVLRNRGDWNQGIEPQTAVTVALPRPGLPVQPSGAIGASVAAVTLRNGQGAVFLTGAAPANAPPRAADDAYGGNEDAGIDVAAPGLLRNDSDPDGDALSAALIAPPARGQLSLRPDGSFTYLPQRDFHGSDGFTYEARDGRGGAARASASVTVRPLNDAPVAVADAYSIGRDATLAVAAPGVLGNDRDVDGDALAALLVSGPAHGTLALAPDGGFTYTPQAGFTGDDGFTYRAIDVSGANSVAVVALLVTGTPVNQPPVAADDAYSVVAGNVLSVGAPGVLANDVDPEGAPLAVTLDGGPLRGSLSLQSHGGFTYTPDAGFTGTDAFTYRASDGVQLGNAARVALAVLPQPSGAVTAAATVTTGAVLGGTSGDLVLAVIACKPYRAVTGVSGLGSGWTRLQAQCAGRNQTGIEIWMSRLGSGGTVTASFAAAPTNAVITACRFGGAADPIPGDVVAANTNGGGGACAGGVDAASYAVNLASPGGLVFAGAAHRNRTHTPGAGYTERAEVHQGSGGDEAAVAVMDRAAPAGTVLVNGSFSSTVDWAVIAVTLRAAAPASKVPAEPPAAMAPQVLVANLRVSPNPAFGAARIAASLPPGTQAAVTIHDVAGRRLRRLGVAAGGSTWLDWDGRDDSGKLVPAGVYFVHLEYGARRLTQKLVLQRDG
jgi:hypothetical protein